MRILVTGGGGFIGSHLCDFLIANGCRVRVLDNLEAQVHGRVNRPTYLSSEAEFIRGDVLDRRSVLSALAGIDAVFHFAAMVGVGQSQYQIERYTKTNVLGTSTLLDVLSNEHHTVRKLLVASSMSVYGEGLYRRRSDSATVVPSPRSEEQLLASDFEMRDPQTNETLEPQPTPESKQPNCESIYALNKKDQEEYCLLFGRTFGLPVTVCRFFNVYGPRQSMSNPYTGVVAIFLSRIKNGVPPLIYEDGLQSRDFIDVRDVVRGCWLLLQESRADGKVFNVGTGQPIAILELAQILIGLAKKDLTPQVTGRYRKGDIRHCYADITQIQVLGFQPSISRCEGLQHLYNWSEEVGAVDQVEMAHGELAKRGLLLGG